MNLIPLQASHNIYIEINNSFISLAKSFSAISSQSIHHVFSFGSDYPVESIPYNTLHKVTIERLQPIDHSLIPNFNLFSLSNFKLSIIKSNSQSIFLNCNWTHISEATSKSSPLIQKIELNSDRRIDSFF